MAARRRPVLVEFHDQFGEKQIIHRDKGGVLKIRQKTPTVIRAMTQVVGKFVGQRIHEERVKAQMTMDLLAERSGLKGGKQAIYHIEQALDTGCRLGTIYAIAAALDVSPFSLLPPVEVVLRESGAEMRGAERLAV